VVFIPLINVMTRVTLLPASVSYERSAVTALHREEGDFFARTAAPRRGTLPARGVGQEARSHPRRTPDRSKARISPPS